VNNCVDMSSRILLFPFASPSANASETLEYALYIVTAGDVDSVSFTHLDIPERRKRRGHKLELEEADSSTRDRREKAGVNFRKVVKAKTCKASIASKKRNTPSPNNLVTKMKRPQTRDQHHTITLSIDRIGAN
jgi:hypothetical protein